MNISPIGLYKSVARLTETALPQAPAQPTARQSFAQMLADTTKRAVETVQGSEQSAMAGLAGRLDAHQVVAAMTQAELTIQATIAVRDKMIAAYQEIMRMPV